MDKAKQAKLAASFIKNKKEPKLTMREQLEKLINEGRLKASTKQP